MLTTCKLLIFLDFTKSYNYTPTKNPAKINDFGGIFIVKSLKIVEELPNQNLPESYVKIKKSIIARIVEAV